MVYKQLLVQRAQIIGFNFHTHVQKKYLTVDKDDIATLSKLKSQKNLKEIIDQIKEDGEILVELFTGTNCTKHLEPIGITSSENDGLYTFRIKLDCCILGLLNRSTKKEQ